MFYIRAIFLMVGFHRMLRLAIINLMIVAFLGFVMRLKILVSIPWLNQKFLLNGHSHFAFIGWVGFAGICFILYLIYKDREAPARVWRFLKIYLANSWVMLVSFLLSGYSAVSMALLLVHIGLSCWFAYWWLKNRLMIDNIPARRSLDLANVFNLISFLGPLILGIMMATKSGTPYARQNAIYMFLHYQYNGYFLYLCLAVFAHLAGPSFDSPRIRKGILVYGIAVTIGIGLLLLMREKPFWFILCNYSASAILIVGATLLLPVMIRAYRSFRNTCSFTVRILWSLSMAGLGLKFVLQALSAIPAVGYMVYEHRAIAIGYLHLVFLVVVTFFFLGFIVRDMKLRGRGVGIGLALFVAGVVFNELLLGAQGIGAILNVLVPHTNTLLAVVSGLMFCGILVLLPAFKNSDIVPTEKNKG